MEAISSITSYSIRQFLPFMCENTFETTSKAIIRDELFNKLMSPQHKVPKHESEINHSEEGLDCRTTGWKVDDKTKTDLDHTCSESKTHSITDSPMKDENSDSKPLVLSKNTEVFSEIVWKFINERYAPYLELLKHCNIEATKYGVYLRNAFNEYFPNLICMDLKCLRTFCNDNNYNKLDIQVLHFGIKLMYFLSYGPEQCATTKIKELQKKRRELDALYNKVVVLVEMREDNQNNKSQSMQYIQLLNLLYSLLFSSEEESLKISELEKDVNLPSLKCAKSIIGNGPNCKILDTVLDKIAESTAKQLGMKRKRNEMNQGKVFSQDPEEMIRNIRRRRSNKTFVSDASIGGTDSPNFLSMGAIEPMITLPSKENRARASASQSIGSTLNFHKKQDKSKINKYSPFQMREKDIQTKRKSKGFARKTGGSNSFLSSNTQQKTKMAIKKGNRKTSSKRQTKKKTYGALELVSRASENFQKAESEVKSNCFSNSFEKIYSNESREPNLACLTQSPDLMQTQTQEDNGRLERIPEKIPEESNFSSEKFQTPQKKEADKVLVLNTPTKSELESKKDLDLEFDF